MMIASIRQRLMQIPRVFVFLLCLGLISPWQEAGAVYVPRFTTTTNGAITFTGNTLGLDNSATSGVPGTRGSIGAFTSTNTALQVGSFPAGTTAAWQSNGSTAQLLIPAGSTVLYAELIWSGSYAYGGQNVSASINTAVTFKTPSGVYSVSPAPATSQTLGTLDANGVCNSGVCRYVRSTNVTGLIQIGQSGTYEIGGVPATANNNDEFNHTAGWTLAVVYGNPTMPPRNLTVFVGAENSGAPATAVNGFCTNLAGPVKGRLLVSAMEGDVLYSRDQMQFGPNTGSMIPLQGPNNPSTNFFGGQINGDTGVLNTTGTFGNRNHTLGPADGGAVTGARQGYDITNVDASASLINSQTSAVARGTTNGDAYTINALGIQIDVGAPKFPATVKTANKTVTSVGDVVTYTITLDNTTGTASASNVVFTDNPPAGMSFVPGSFTLNGVTQASANPVAGVNVGTIAAGASAVVTVQMVVNALPAAPARAEFSNFAKWTYDFVSCAGFPSEAGTMITNPIVIPAVRLAPTKAVSPTGPVGVGQVLTYTITVPNTGAINSVGTTLTDLIPTGTTYLAGSTFMNGAAVPDLGANMPYVAGALINSASLAVGVIGANASATIQFKVTVNPSPPAIITNTAAIDPDGSGPATVINVSATNTPLTPPVASKSFAPSTIAANTPSVLTVLISNPNAQGLTVLAFSDTLPAGVVIANPPNISTTCGGTPLAVPGGITLGLSSGSVPASGSCTVSANVTSASPGVYTNIIPAGGVTTTNAGNNVAAATATLTVLQGPTLNKSFSPASIAPNGISTLTISVVNPTNVTISNANVTDNLPAGVVVAATPNATSNCAGTFAPVAGASSVSLVNGLIAAANVCTVTVNVTSATVGNYNNVIPAGALTSSGGTNSTAAIADISVTAPLISKSFSPPVVGVNVISTLTISITNPTNVAATGVTFTDLFPTTPGAMTVASTTTTNSCNPPATNSALFNPAGGALAVGSTGVRLNAGSIPAGGSCTITVRVRASAGGNYVNSIPAGGLTTTNIGSNTLAAAATLSVGLPGVEKVFGAFGAPITSFPIGGSVPVSIRITNPNTTLLNLTTLTDILPSGMQLFNTTTTNSCGGSFTDASGAALVVGSTSIRHNGGSIPSGGTCTFTFQVTSNVAGAYVNTIPVGGLVTSAGNNAFAVNAPINALARPIIAKSFTPSTISPTGTSSLQITLTNPNAETLTSATFTDTFPTAPGALTLANTTITNTCGGTVTQGNDTALAVGSNTLKLAGGSIPGNGSCQITATVTASALGMYNNVIGVAGLTTNNGGANTVAATATLTVSVLPPTITKAFAASPVGKSVPTRLTFSINNPNVALGLTAVSFSDIFPTSPGAMLVAPVPNILINGCGGASTFTAAPNAASVSFSGGAVASSSTCQVSVDVVASVAGTYNNTSSVVNSSAGSGPVATASLRVLESPFVAKSFSVSPISVGGSSLLTITISNPNATDSLSAVAVSDVYPGALANTATPNPQVVCSGGSSAAFTGGAANGNSVGLTSGSLSPGGFCSVSINVTATSAGNIDNTTGNVTSGNAGTGNAATARLVVGINLSGFVYSDANSSGTKDGAEAGTGLTLFAKLISGGAVQQTVSVNATTGAYLFGAVLPGSYTIIVDTNNTASDVTPTIPAGWTGTEIPAQSRFVPVNLSAIANLNFGLNNGARVSGRVFQDTGISGGIPNDAIPNGGELGLANVTVRLTNCAGTTLASALTDGSGNYSLSIPAATSNGAALCVIQTLPSGFIETGAGLGTTASASGAYSRPTSTVNFVFAAGTSHTGVNFGNVPVNTFSTDGVQTALAGTVVNYPHTFVAGTGGQVTFSTGAVASPSLLGWSEVIYRDTNCNGQLDAGEPTLNAALTVSAGDQVCVIVREFIPGGAPLGAQNLVTLTASFVYVNAAPALSANLTHTDTTTVGNATSSGLKLVKSVNQATALPGSTLVYTITYRNDSIGPLSTLVVNDATPSFTTFVNALCGPLPANLTACSVTTSPAVGGQGGIVWTFTGTLTPAAQGTITFSVLVNN